MITNVNESQGTVKEMTDKLVSDVKSVGADAEGVVRGMASSGAGQLAAVRTRLEERFGDARSKFDGVRASVTEKAKGTADAGQKYVMENPWKAIGIAAAAGLLFGILTRRR